MNGISTGYRKLDPAEVDQVAGDCAKAWTDPAIPARQYELAVKDELAAFRTGGPSVPFDALVKCLRKLPLKFLATKPRLLDIGASGGYYREVLELAGFHFKYTGADFSPAFKDLAEKLYPGIDFDIADARALPYHDGMFDIVLSGAVLMHVAEFAKVIAETSRVARRYVVFHRTPIVIERPTVYFEKCAYDVRCLEVWFNERELLDLFAKHGMNLIHSENIFWSQAEGYGHWTYLLEKQPGLTHVQV